MVLTLTWPHALNISHHENLITSTSLCLNKHKSGSSGVPVACLVTEIMDKLLGNNIPNKPSTTPINSLAKNMQNLIWLILRLHNMMTCYETNMASTIFPSGNKVQFEKKLVLSNEYKKILPGYLKECISYAQWQVKEAGNTGCTNFSWPYLKHSELKPPSEQFNSETYSKIADCQEKN